MACRTGGLRSGGYPGPSQPHGPVGCMQYTYTKVSGTVVDPTGCRVHKPGGVQLSHSVRQLKLGVGVGNLAPALVVNDLSETFSNHYYLPDRKQHTQMAILG